MSAIRKTKQVIERLAAASATNVAFAHAGRHEVAILEFNKRRRKVFFSCSPSDVNAIHNVVRDTRRTIRELQQ
jgi:hypothetical protein